MIRRALLRLAVVGVMAMWAGGVHAASNDIAGLLATAMSQGSVRVIVKLTASGIVPEGELDDDAWAIFLQRLDIADRQDLVEAALASHLHRVHHRYVTSPYLALEVSPDALRALASSPLVDTIAEDFELWPTLNRSGPIVQATTAHDLGVTGSGQVVVTIDSGVDRTHPFLAGRIVEEWCFVAPSGCPGSSPNASGPGAATDGAGHGTHVAGIAAGAGGSFSGMAPASNIIAIKVFPPPPGGAFFSDIKAALDRVILLKNTWTIAAVNMSLGTTAVSPSTCDATDPGLKPDIDTLRAAGIATVVATGNNSSASAISYPACLSNTIKVGASTNDDVIAVYSNRAPGLESTTLLAPGGDAGSINICSSYIAGVTSSWGSCSNVGTGGSFAFDVGTSVATPHVTGAWALLKQVKPTATVDEVLAALRSSALPIYDPSSGLSYKRIQIRDAFSALLPRATLATVTPDKSAPQAVGTTVTFTAVATGGATPYQFKWWLNTDGGPMWTLLQDWSTSNTLTWTPTVANPAYQIATWVRSSGDPLDTYESNKFASFAIIVAPPAVLSSVTPDKSAPQIVGTSITFTAAATSGTAPYQFKWWLNTDGGPMWTLLQDWSTSNTLTWTPTVANPAYQIATWVRSTGNPGDTYENNAFMSFAINPRPLASLSSVTPDKTAPQTVGTTVMFTATATSGTAPYQFKWWLNTDGGPMWTLLQDWSTSNTLTWTPTVANSGYQIATWVRSSGKTADTYENNAFTSFAINPRPPAVLSSVIPDKSAPQIVGTSITFTAAATSGTAPYQFKWWLNTDGGPMWTLLQDWSTSNTLTWTPTVANAAYQIATWVRSSGNPADTYENNKFTSFAINPSPSPP